MDAIPVGGTRINFFRVFDLRPPLHSFSFYPSHSFTCLVGMFKVYNYRRKMEANTVYPTLHCLAQDFLHRV